MSLFRKQWVITLPQWQRLCQKWFYKFANVSVVISRGTCLRGANVRSLADHVTLQFQGWVTQHNPYRLAIGKERVPIQLAQCWFPIAWPFPMLKYKYVFFSNKIYGSNFVKRHSETVMVWNYQNADCSLKINMTVLFITIFGTLPFPIAADRARQCLGYAATAVGHIKQCRVSRAGVEPYFTNAAKNGADKTCVWNAAFYAYCIYTICFALYL